MLQAAKAGERDVRAVRKRRQTEGDSGREKWEQPDAAPRSVPARTAGGISASMRLWPESGSESEGSSQKDDAEDNDFKVGGRMWACAGGRGRKRERAGVVGEQERGQQPDG